MGWGIKKLFRRKPKPGTDDAVPPRTNTGSGTATSGGARSKKATKSEQDRAILQQQQQQQKQKQKQQIQRHRKGEVGPAGRAPARVDANHPHHSPTKAKAMMGGPAHSFTPTNTTSRDSNSSREREAEAAGSSPTNGYTTSKSSEHSRRVLSPRSHQMAGPNGPSTTSTSTATATATAMGGKPAYQVATSYHDENLDHSNTAGSSPHLSHHQLQQFDRQNARSPRSSTGHSNVKTKTNTYTMPADIPRGQMAAMDDMNRSEASGSSFNLSTDAEDSEYEHLRRRGVLPGGGPGANASTLDTSTISSPTAYTTDDERIFAALQTDDDMTAATNPSLKEFEAPPPMLRPVRATTSTTPDDEPGRIPVYTKPPIKNKTVNNNMYTMNSESEDDLRAWTLSPSSSSTKDHPSSTKSGVSQNSNQRFTFDNTSNGGRTSKGTDASGSNGTPRSNGPMDPPASTTSRGTAVGTRSFTSPKSQTSSQSGFSPDPDFANFADFDTYGPSNAFSSKNKNAAAARNPNAITSSVEKQSKHHPHSQHSSWRDEKKVSEMPPARHATARDFQEFDQTVAMATGATSPRDGNVQYAHSATGHDSSLSELLAQAKNKQRRNSRGGSRNGRVSSSSVNSAPAITASYLRQQHNLGRYSAGGGGGGSNVGSSNNYSESRLSSNDGTSVSDIIHSLEATNQSRHKPGNANTRSSYGHRSVGDTGAVSTARAVKERLRERRRKERDYGANVHKSRSSEGSSSENSENEASESWLFDEVTGALGPRGIAADLESLSGRSNRSKNSQGNKSHKSHRSRSRRNRHSSSRRHKSTGDSVDSRNSRYSHRSTKSYLSQMSEQSRSVANDLLRLEMQLAMVGSQENRDDVPVRVGGGSVSGTSVGGASRTSRSGRKSLSSNHRAVGHGSVASASHITRRSKVTVLAPPGKLGIILANKADSKGTVVSGVRTSSVLAAKVSPGDRVIAIDGEDVSRMTVSEITTIMSRKADYDRTLTILTTPKHMDNQYSHRHHHSSSGGSSHHGNTGHVGGGVAMLRSPSNGGGGGSESFDNTFSQFRR